MTDDELRNFRATTARIVFQDPGSSLNPIRTIGWQLVESIQAARPVPKRVAADTALELLNTVGIADAKRRLNGYPHEMSGGMLQRIMIAMALAAQPRFLICDEVTSALDVTTEAQIVELLRNLNRDLGMAVIFTTHDLSLVGDLCERVIIMYSGRVVESGASDLFATRPVHPYSRLLREAAPESAPADTRLKVIEGAPPRPTDDIPGCAFHPRCPLRIERCLVEMPPLVVTSDDPGHSAACWVTAGE
jgi:oligopeptide/dipeptide ABC transporter ATP-binding protein